jgi:hypothetical protein
MRELAAAALLLLALAVGALAPRIWPDETQSGALASGRPGASGPLATVASTAFAAVSWKGKDGGTGYVGCGSTDNWSRPTVVEQNAHLAADPRYAGMRADDPKSDASAKFEAPVLLYDGSTVSARVDLVALTGMWTDPHIGGNAIGCTSTEPQVWLIGYEPVSFRGSPGVAELGVRQAPGYRMVILTGEIGTDLVVFGGPGGKIAAFDTRALRGPTPTPALKATPTLNAIPSPDPVFPITDRPVGFALPAACQIQRWGRHVDDMGATWVVQCGSAQANLAVAVAAITQGWSRMEGPPIGVGIQVYMKGTLSMQLAYRLDGPGFSEPFSLVQYSRPFAQGAAVSRPSANAYLRVPTGFDLPTGCLWKEASVGFTDEGAYRLPFTCPALKPDEIQATFTRAIEAQGWQVGNGGFGFLTYAKGDLRLTATFTTAKKAESSDVPWVVESLCCYAP